MSNGGPAFPLAIAVSVAGDLYDSSQADAGMSLRVYLASKAMTGLLTNPSMISPGQLKASKHHDNLVTLSFEIADAMLKQREDST